MQCQDQVFMFPLWSVQQEMRLPGGDRSFPNKGVEDAVAELPPIYLGSSREPSWPALTWVGITAVDLVFQILSVVFIQENLYCQFFAFQCGCRKLKCFGATALAVPETTASLAMSSIAFLSSASPDPAITQHDRLSLSPILS